MPMREMAKDAIWQIVGVALVFLIALGWAWLVTNHAGAYTPDHIDLERAKNWAAQRSHDCFWYGERCRAGGWRHRYHYAPQPDRHVMAAQLRLRDLGYYEDRIDGLSGPQTREAIWRFQRDQRDLRATGELDHATKAALYDENAGRYRRGREGDAQWSRRPEICRERDGKECACDPVIAFSGEHVGKDARLEALKRWRGHVRAMFGETWHSWKMGKEPGIISCWGTGTGERGATDRLGHTRCVAERRPCFVPGVQEETDEVDEAPPRKRGD